VNAILASFAFSIAKEDYERERQGKRREEKRREEKD